ncbi:MAG: MBL fold metallo-hydrolase [Candidatus Moraniibacteriota bacterium]|nr:MAG: MBL fold metallo-hydrolase [Candidatus Moranbacteria bacterium]
MTFVFGWHIFQSTWKDSSGIKVSFLDVGQGDAILLSSGNIQVLIDGGPNPKILLDRLRQEMPYNDRHIEMVIATHPDADHIGGFSELMPVYEIGLVGETNTEKDTAVYRAWRTNLETYTTPRKVFSWGDRFVFPNGAVVNILHPSGKIKEAEKDINKASLVLFLEYGAQSFLFTGDLPGEQESFLDVSNVDVLKVAHHGSKSSTTENFLEKIHPIDAIISVGNDNKYGHPDSDILKRLEERDVRIVRTDVSGTITYYCKNEFDSCQIRVRR